MSNLHISFNTQPPIAGAMVKALLLPRKGFKASIGLPAIKASWLGAKVNADSLKEYETVLGLTSTQVLPVLYPHVLAGGMHMHMLSHPAFPIRLLGSVHLKNNIKQYQAIHIQSEMDISSAIGDYRLTEKGLEFDFSTQVKVNGDVVWEEVSIYFKAGKFGGKEQPSKQSSFELDSLTDAKQVADWEVPKNRGKQYAKITGDYNPIHMSPTLAKLFGLKRDIAHGFGVLAQAIEQARCSISHGSCQVDVVFKGPVYLQNQVNVQKNTEQNENRFDVFCGNNPKPSICSSVSAL
jgi:hypothetical protein